MLKKLAAHILKLSGWKVEVELPKEKKYVLTGAPHTSNWDLVLVLLACWSIDIKINWVAKVEIFRGPLRTLFTALGGIPVDRSASHDFINMITETFNHRDEMILGITPEGTRSKTDYWKTGFYYIALSANVPVYFGYIDYHNRTLGFKQRLAPSGDIESDMKIVADFYRNIKGKHPQNQGPVRIKNK
ncbi:MAG: lysophospholipid acyltransferase family protein [Gammaproteobacteria bacterium]|nr:lysophospholipid acyltransferase family protein [Gammaproteobacteria bacterium]